MNAFRFFTKHDQVLLLGLRAKGIEELLAGIHSAPDSSIYFHTHRFLQQHRSFSPEPPNDFAYWVTRILGDETLGELLWSVDTIRFNDIRGLREALVTILNRYLAAKARRTDCEVGEEFHFMACRTFVLPTAHIARDLKTFADVLSKISVNSVYFHVFDAKMRLKSGENDFSRWFKHLGKLALAKEAKRLDPYSFTLDGLRQRLVSLVREHDSH
jgi:Family of unknown function (DUF5752)